MDRQIALTEDTCREVRILSERLGYPPEMAVHYAVRLVNACIREGLLSDISAEIRPEDAQSGAHVLRSTGTMGKVIEFPRV